MQRKKGRNRTARYGEPEQYRSKEGGSPRLPRRKESFDGDENSSRTSTAAAAAPPPPPPSPPSTIPRTRTASFDDDDDDDDMSPFIYQLNDGLTVDRVFSSTHRKNFGRLNRVNRFRSPVGFEHEIETNRPGWGSNELLDERPVVLLKNQRRASTGTRDFLDSSPFGFDPQRSQGMSFGTTRPCMDNSNHSAPIIRRRTSLTGTRPCMDGYADEPTAFDRPALRPYRQLSSEDLCIGEETEEDLSNRSMLRTGDASNRSNRSAFNNNSDDPSNRSMRRTADSSNRSNRSAFTNDLSNRSYRTMDDISIQTFRTLDDFSQRSYHTNMDDMNNRSNQSLHMSNHSLSMRSTHIPQVVSEGNEDDSTVGPLAPSPENDEVDISFNTANEDVSCRTAKEEASIRTACTTQTQEPEEHSQSSENESSEKNPLNCRPEPWPVDDEELVKPSTVKKHQRSRPSVSKSKTWPNNLMVLLSTRRLGLKKSPSFADGNSSRTSISSFEESDDSFSNQDVVV